MACPQAYPLPPLPVAPPTAGASYVARDSPCSHNRWLRYGLSTLTAIADSGVLIAAINWGDRHHRWAVARIAGARQARDQILVPEPVAGEAYTALRYDKRVSPRRDGGIALCVFAMIDDNPDTFRTLAVPVAAHGHAQQILACYWDHAFSYVDALIFHMADANPSVSYVLTVDGADFRSYRFERDIHVLTPE